MTENKNGFEIIKSLLNGGFLGVNVEFTDQERDLFKKGLISFDNGVWTISGAFQIFGKPIEDCSLEALMDTISLEGWKSFSVEETIVAMAEDDLECRCGNTVDGDGFYSCDSQGNEVVPLPVWGDLVICAKCGIIFDESSYDAQEHTLDIVGVGKYKPLPVFEVGNSVGFLKGFVDTDEYHIVNSLDQISAFVMAFASESETTIVTMLDKLVLTTMGGFINRCPDKNFLGELKSVLVPMQMGESESILFAPIPYEAE